VNDELPETPVAVETGPLCVAADSDNKDAALEYSKWWMRDEAQPTWSESRGNVSFNPNAPPSDDELNKLTELATSDETLQLPRWLEATPNDIYTVASEEFGDFIVNNGDPKQHLERIQEAADSYWENQE